MVRRPARLLVALAVVLGSGLLPAATAAATPTTERSTGPSAPERRPTIHYEDALAHAGDRIAFDPGGRVRIPFRPSADDAWLVDGEVSRPLPAGRLSGRVILELPTRPDAGVEPALAPPRFGVTAEVDPGALRREVFGFLPYWELADGSTRLDWARISTVAYFGVGADGDGDLVKRNPDGSTTVGWSGWTSSKMTSVIEAAHQSHARVVLTVQSFAWSSSGLKRQKALLGSPAARSNLAHQIARAIRDRGADGVNLDFEPIASGYADEFTALVRKVRAVLNDTARGYQLTFDTTGWIGNYPIEAATAKGGADAIVIMGYDYRQSGSARVGSIAPIDGPTYDIGDTLRAYLERVPPSRLILGVPYYGRAWSAASDKVGAKNISGTKNGASVAVMYDTAREFAAEHGKRYDPIEGVAWTAYKRENCTPTYGCVKPWRQLYFDDARAIKAKYDLVNRYDLRGAGIWALGYDGTRKELYQAIEDRFITDTVPPVITAGAVSAATFSPNGDGHTDTTTATLSATGLVSWGYTVKPLVGGQVGKTIRSGSAAGRAPSFTWDGRDRDGDRVKDRSYRITLWTADISDNRAERTFTVVVDTTRATASQRNGLGFFSPDADRHNDTLPLAWNASEPLTGVVRVRDAAGRSVRSWTVTDRTAWEVLWTGKTAAGAVVRDGRYTFRVDGRDRAGNRTVVERPILVDGTIKSVRWSATAFDPRAKERSRAEIVLRRAADLTVTIQHGDVVVRTVWTGKHAVAGTVRWTWDGTAAADRRVKPGDYRIVVTATSRFGTTRFSKGLTVLVH